MKIQKIDEKEELSWFSRLTRFLISVNIIPVNRTHSEEIRFSWFSLRTLLFLTGSYLPIGIILFCFLFQYDFLVEYFEKSTTIYLKFEVIIIDLSVIFLFLSSPVQVLCLCRPFTELQEISMDKSLKFLNKIDLFQTFFGIAISFSFTAFLYAHYMEVCKLVENATPDQCFANVFVVPLFLIMYSVVFLLISYNTVYVWLQHIEEIFTRQNVANKIEWAEQCMKIYSRLEQFMGPYFFLWATQSQLVWTILFFLAISLAISNNGFSTISVLMHSLGNDLVF